MNSKVHFTVNDPLATRVIEAFPDPSVPNELLEAFLKSLVLGEPTDRILIDCAKRATELAERAANHSTEVRNAVIAAYHTLFPGAYAVEQCDTLKLIELIATQSISKTKAYGPHGETIRELRVQLANAREEAEKYKDLYLEADKNASKWTAFVMKMGELRKFVEGLPL